MEEDLVARGLAVRIETVGRRSGRRRVAVVGFLEAPDGSLLVSAGDAGADWAQNLLADPHCRVTVADEDWDATALPLDGDDHASAVRGLILRYGTPSERLGSGPSFRLVRAV